MIDPSSSTQRPGNFRLIVEGFVISIAAMFVALIVTDIFLSDWTRAVLGDERPDFMGNGALWIMFGIAFIQMPFALALNLWLFVLAIPASFAMHSPHSQPMRAWRFLAIPLTLLALAAGWFFWSDGKLDWRFFGFVYGPITLVSSLAAWWQVRRLNRWLV